MEQGHWSGGYWWHEEMIFLHKARLLVAMPITTGPGFRAKGRKSLIMHHASYRMVLAMAFFPLFLNGKCTFLEFLLEQQTTEGVREEKKKCMHV